MEFELKCEHCGRHLGYPKGTVLLEGLICPNSKCKERLNIKVVTSNSSDRDIRFKFAEKEVESKGARS